MRRRASGTLSTCGARRRALGAASGAVLLGALAWGRPAAAQVAGPQPEVEVEEVKIDEAPAATSEEAALRAATEAVQAAREAAEAARDAARAARDAVAALAAAPAPEAAPAAGEAPPAWSGQGTASLISLTGNANTVTASLSGTVSGDWRGWSTQFTAGASYGQTRPEDAAEAEVTALAGQLSARGERKFAEFLGVYVSSGVATDHVASVELRAYGEPGLSVTWLERTEGDLVRSRLRTDFGLRVAQEDRYQYFPVAMNLPDLTLYQVRLAADFRYALTRTTVFSQTLEALEDLANTSDFRFNASTAVSAQVVEGVGLQLAFEYRHNGNPAPGKVEDDTRLSAGVTVTF